MKKTLFILLLILTTTMPAFALTNNTSGPWGIGASGFKNLSTALASPSTVGKTIVISEPVTINNKVTDRAIRVIKGGLITVASGKTFTVNGPFDAGNYQVFAGSGSVSFGTEYGGVVTPDWKGVNGDIAPYDTAAVQWAYDTGKPVHFTRSYYVENVKFDGVGRIVKFNGFSLVGTSVEAKDYLLAITGRDLTLYDVKVNANFKPYNSAVRWYSENSSAPAQYNKLYNMRISYAIRGLTFGNIAGSASVDAAQSENTISGLTFRGVQVCFTGNQTNGFLTLITPILDCNPYEWSTQPGYDATAWHTAARAFVNVNGKLLINGGEILKTASTLGYGFEGKDFTTVGASYEIACKWGLLTGNVTIRDTGNGYMATDNGSAFTIDSTAAGSRLLLDNFALARATNVGGYSASYFIDSVLCPTFKADIVNCRLTEWKSTLLVLGCPFTLKNCYVKLDSAYLSTDGVNLLGVDPYGNDVPSSGATSGVWTLVNGGGGTPTATKVASTDFPNITTAIEFTGVGGEAKFYSHFFRVVSGRYMLIHAYMARMSGSGNSQFTYTFYGADRAIIGTANSTSMTTTVGTYQLFSKVILVPTGAVWMRINIQLDLTAVVRYSEIVVKGLENNVLPNSTIYLTSAPTVGTWAKGERVVNLAPAVGQPKSWVCTVAGTPGTWVSEGNL